MDLNNIMQNQEDKQASSSKNAANEDIVALKERRNTLQKLLKKNNLDRETREDVLNELEELSKKIPIEIEQIPHSDIPLALNRNIPNYKNYHKWLSLFGEREYMLFMDLIKKMGNIDEGNKVKIIEEAYDLGIIYSYGDLPPNITAATIERMEYERTPEYIAHYNKVNEYFMNGCRKKKKAMNYEYNEELNDD